MMRPPPGWWSSRDECGTKTRRLLLLLSPGAPSCVAREKRPLFETTKASLSTKGGKTEPRRRPPCWASKGNTNASSIESRPLLSSNFCDDSLFLSLSLSLKEALSLKVVVVVGKRRRRPSSSFSSFVSPLLLSRRKAKPTTPTTPKTERKRATLFGGFF